MFTTGKSTETADSWLPEAGGSEDTDDSKKVLDFFLR